MVTIDEALEYTGFGWYSYLLLALTCCTSCFSNACVFAINYALPYATCEFKMDKITQGAVSSVSFLGVGFISLFTGLIADRFGRKKVLLVSFVMAIFIVFGIAFAPNSLVLVIMNFCLGLLHSSSVPIIVTFISESQASKYSTGLSLFVGVCEGISIMFSSSMAAAIIPLEFSLKLGSQFTFTSWRLYILVSLLGCLFLNISFLYFCFESPKYVLVTSGPDKAYDIIKKISVWNNRKWSNDFPKFQIEQLNSSPLKKSHANFWLYLKSYYTQMKPTFTPPYLKPFLVLTVLLFIDGMRDSLFISLPQFYTLLSDYEILYANSSNELFCRINERMSVNDISNNTWESDFCLEKHLSSTRFYNSIILGGVISLVILIQIKLEKIFKENVQFALFNLCNAILILLALYLPDSLITISLAVLMSISNIYLLYGYITKCFPTSIRAFVCSFSWSIFSIGDSIILLIMPDYFLSIYCNQYLYGLVFISLCLALSSLILDNVFIISNSKKK